MDKSIMKILIQKNKISTSLRKKLQNVKEWFAPVFDIEFVEEKTNHDFINGNYSYYDIYGKLQYFQAVDQFWYDEHISIPAKNRGFDVVIFIVPKKSWINRIVEGFGTTTPNHIVEEIAISYFDSTRYDFMGVRYKGDKLEWIIIHELIHRFYNMRKLPDNTHKYFLAGTPEKCLEDFKKEEETETWKYFKLTEKTGSLGHTVADLDPTLVDKLDELRGLCGFPFIITSGYRTPEENARVGGIAGSAHTKRLAVDVLCNDSSKRRKIERHALENGFIGIGFDKVYVHLDLDNSKEERTWIY